jgi:replication-associated recombination protein RarA
MRELLSDSLRPSEFWHLLQSTSLVSALQRMVEHEAPINMLFYGSPGLGKTSAARILIQKMDADPFSINGSMETGIDVVRDIRPATKATLGLFHSGPRIIFIDEADYLSKNAQAGLRGLIEEAHLCRFLLTANDITKLSPALKSRCIPVCFDPHPGDAPEVIERITPRLVDEIKKAGFDVTCERLQELLYFYFPDIRSVLTRIEFESPRQPAA